MLLFALIIPPCLRGRPHVVTGYRYKMVLWSRFNVTAYIATPFRPVRRHFETWAYQREQSIGLPQNLQKMCSHTDPVPTFRSRPCTRASVPCLNSHVRIWKKGVFTLVPSDYRTRAPCSGTRCKRCLICFRMPSSINGTRTGSARKETTSTVHGCCMFLWIL